MEDAPRRRRWAVAAGVLLAAGLVIVALAASWGGGGSVTSGRSGAGSTAGSTAGSGRDGGPSADDVAALDDLRSVPHPSTTDVPAGGAPTSVPAPGPDGTSSGAEGGSVVPLAPADCASVARVVIPAARIITAADFVPIDERAVPAKDPVYVDDVARVVSLVPADQRPAWERVATEISRGRAHPTTAQERADLQAARNRSEVWARAACPDAPPSWRCDDFGSISGPDVAPTLAQGSSPEALVARVSGVERRVLARTDRVVLYGWVDDAGFVVRTQQIERVGGGWATTRRHICHSG
jgi:hypothetical protein